MPQGVRVRVSPGRLLWVCGGILVCTSDLRSDAVRIESSNLSRPNLYVDVAQLVEQKTENFRVVGSIPIVRT